MIMNKLLEYVKLDKRIDTGFEHSLSDFIADYVDNSHFLYETEAPLERYNDFYTLRKCNIIPPGPHADEIMRREDDLKKRMSKAGNYVMEYFVNKNNLSDNMYSYLYAAIYSKDARWRYDLRALKDDYIRHEVIYPTQNEIPMFKVKFEVAEKDIVELLFNDNLDDVVNGIIEMEENEIDFPEVKTLIQGYGKRLLADPNQLELDLSKINKNMSEFNKFIKTILEDLSNQGTGSYVQRVKQTNPTPNAQQTITGNTVSTTNTTSNPSNTNSQLNKNMSTVSAASPNTSTTNLSPQAQQLFTGYQQNMAKPNPSWKNQFVQKYTQLSDSDRQGWMNQFKDDNSKNQFLQNFTPQEQQAYGFISQTQQPQPQYQPYSK
jgi:hypothetical protein